MNSEFGIKFFVGVSNRKGQQKLVLLKIVDGEETEEFEMAPDDATLTGTQLIRASHKIRNAK